MPRSPLEPSGSNFAVDSAWGSQIKDDHRMHQQLRQRLRQQRAQLNAAFCQQAAQKVADTLLKNPVFQHSEHIACYASHQQELPTLALLTQMQHANKHIYLPVMITQPHKQLDFYPYTSEAELIPNAYQILEPNAQKLSQKPIDELDLILIPLVGFDPQCHRIGMGAGFYDRTLAQIHHQTPRPQFIGLAYEMQKLPHISPEPWDIALDQVITEIACYQRLQPA